MGLLSEFSFGFGYGNERHGIYGLDNVLWDNGEICIALYKGEDDADIRVDFGKGAREDGVYPLDYSTRVPDLLTAKCIALEWLTNNPTGGNYT